MSLAEIIDPIRALWNNVEFWKFLSIPVVAGLVGWSTNWAAIQLTFYPLRFLGIPPYLGWQGIIPSKARKMAGIFVDSTMSRLGTLPELFEKMEPERIAEQVNRVILPRMDRYTDEALFAETPEIWSSTPEVVRRQVYKRVREELPALVENLLEEARGQVDELIDFKDMITTRLEEDPALLNRLIRDSGEEEFRFIIRSGLYFGFLFGIVQLVVWYFYRGAWVLPTFGLLVGYATNWIALNVIFRPLYPMKVGPWTFQGLFLQRQQEVARVWCRLVTREIVTVRAIVHAMLYGPCAEKTQALIRKHIEPLVREAAGPLDLPAQLTLGPATMEALRERVGDKAQDVSGDPFDDWHFNRDRSRIVERLLRERMEALSPEEFQDLLRPCFQEDELKLILIGAALGFGAGLLQFLFVFGGG